LDTKKASSNATICEGCTTDQSFSFSSVRVKTGMKRLEFGELHALRKIGYTVISDLVCEHAMKKPICIKEM